MWDESGIVSGPAVDALSRSQRLLRQGDLPIFDVIERDVDRCFPGGFLISHIMLGGMSYSQTDEKSEHFMFHDPNSEGCANTLYISSTTFS